MLASGDAIQTWIARRHPGLGSVTGSPLQAVFIAAGVALMVGVILTHPSGVTGAERWRLWLDAATVMVGAGVFLWSSESPKGASAPILAVSTVALVSVFGLVRLALGRFPPFTFSAGIVGIVGVASFGLITALAPEPTASRQLGTLLMGRLLPSVLIAITPRIQELQARGDPTALVRRRKRPYSLLPYVAVAATQVLLVRVAFDRQLTVKAWGVVIGVVFDHGACRRPPTGSIQ